jgi:hypothetical protein
MLPKEFPFSFLKEKINEMGDNIFSYDGKCNFYFIYYFTIYN